MNTVLILVAFIVTFFIAFSIVFWAYRRGLKDGLAINQGKQIESIKDPVTTIKNKLEQHHQEQLAEAEANKLINGMNNIFAYDGSEQKREE